MKSYIKFLVISLVLIISTVILPKQASAQQTYVSFQIFYDQLSPYGEWVDYLNYGYVWIPDVGSDFTPYSTDGHWILTNYGWTWVSDYDWGWAPFHYGRWDYDNNYGWFWVPDTEWGPAWVTWRSANGYYGWAPMEPGISISISFGSVYNRNKDHWIFVRDRDIERSDIHNYYVNKTYNERIIRNSSVINKTYVDNRRNTTYVTGPAREDVQKVTGRTVNPIAIQENDRPGQNLSNGQLRIFRPQVNKNNEREQKPVPSKIINLKDLKRPSDRNAPNQPRVLIPSTNNSQEQQPNTINRQNNNNNNNNNAKPVQPQDTKPTPNNNRVEQPNSVNRQNNNNNNTKPVQTQNANPTPNNSRVNQPNTVNRQNNNNNAKTVQPQNSNPSSNNSKVQPPKEVRPSKNNNNNKKQSKESKSNVNKKQND